MKSEFETLLATTKENRFLVVRVYYQLGGYSGFTARNEPRGYYLSVSPETRRTEPGLIVREFKMFSGYKKFLLETKRQSPKALQKAIALATPALVAEMVAAVIAQQAKRLASGSGGEVIELAPGVEARLDIPVSYPAGS